MMIYNKTSLYISQLVYVHFMSGVVKWMTCRWDVENDIIMYATAIDLQFTCYVIQCMKWPI